MGRGTTANKKIGCRINNGGILIKKYNLLEIIKNIDNIDLSLSICIPKISSSITSGTECLLVTEDEFEEESDIVGEFNYLCGVHVIQDILENLREQKRNFNNAEALQAVYFYINNDAFIVL